MASYKPCEAVDARRYDPPVLPVEHFIVAFLPVSLVIVGVTRRPPSPPVVGAVFLGSQFPDLIDKPLALSVGVIPTGRVFMHSLPIAIPFLLAVGVYGWRTDRLDLAVVFGVAHLTHLLADTYHTLIGSRTSVSPDLLWPLADPIARPGVPHWAGPNGINIHLWTGWAVVVLVWAGWWLRADSV